MRSSGIITARTCPLCGHHEMGFTTNDGEFHPLKPGTRINIVEESPAHEDPEKDKGLEKWLKKLSDDSKAIGKVVQNGDDEAITKSIFALHDVFHEIIGLCDH